MDFRGWYIIAGIILYFIIRSAVKQGVYSGLKKYDEQKSNSKIIDFIDDKEGKW